MEGSVYPSPLSVHAESGVLVDGKDLSDSIHRAQVFTTVVILVTVSSVLYHTLNL
jgi:hypothetical protein